MEYKLRIARATNDLQKIAKMYSAGLSLKALGSFKDHDGFDGVMLGTPGDRYHFEFTQEQGQSAPRSNSAENLLVFYISEPAHWEQCRQNMLSAGFQCVRSHNPYWDANGLTFEDFEGYRVVLCRQSWGSPDKLAATSL